MKHNITAEVLVITPKIASVWLANRWGDQRNVRLPHVEKLAADMKAGLFCTGPDAILRVAGKLANGQHRLEAVILSGLPQSFLVMESEDTGLYKIIDAGLKRSAADALTGMSYARKIPPAARLVRAYELKTIRLDVTQCDVINYCIDHKNELIEAVAFVEQLRSETVLLAGSIGSALYVIASRRGLKDKVSMFLKDVYAGGGGELTEMLRNRLINSCASKSRLKSSYVFALTLKALKYYIDDVAPGRLFIRDGQDIADI